MNKISPTENLKIRILQLEIQKSVDLAGLKAELISTGENLKPINLLKNGFREAVTSPGMKQSVMGAAAGLATGYLSKAVIVGSSHNPVKRMIGSVVQLLISSSIAQHPEIVNKLATGLLGMIGKKGETKD